MSAILLVEDEFLVRLFAIDALEDAGFRVLPAETAAAALKHLQSST
jgi:DNA-binding response OmpR family regulator